MTNPQVAIDITTNDKSAKGTTSAERRLEKLGGTAAKIGKDVNKVGGFGNIIKTFADVDRAANDAFGNKSVFGGLGRRASAFGKIGSVFQSGLGRTAVSLGRVSSVGEGAAATLGETAVAAGAAEAGMGEAAASASALAIAMGPVAVVGAAVVATLGAAAIAGYKFASGWAAGTAQMGRFAETIGIASKNLQELQQAGERYGIGKDATNSSVAGFAQTVHDARYGRNNDALALMMRLGVKFRQKADGTLDYDAMLGDTSDALARQKDPQTALMIANRLGVAGMLPLLRKGSANLRGEQADVDKHGAMNSDADIATAQQFTRNAVILKQLADRAKQGAQAWTAGKYAPVLGKGVDLGRSATDGTLGGSVSAIGESIRDRFVPAADKIDRAANKMLDASNRIVGGNADAFVAAIQNRGERSRDNQVSPAGARGRMQVMPFTAHHPGYGIRPAANESVQEYNRVGGEYAKALLAQYGGDWALASAAYNAGPGKVNGWIKKFGDPRTGQISDAEWISKIPGHGPHTYEETRRYAERVAEPVPVHVTVELKNAPPGTKATATAGRSKAPAVSHAMAD